MKREVDLWKKGLSYGKVECKYEETFRERGLSRREIEVAALLVQEGLTAGEIGERLYISERTVNDHIAGIYRKFAVRKRAEFMALFVGK